MWAIISDKSSNPRKAGVTWNLKCTDRVRASTNDVPHIVPRLSEWQPWVRYAFTIIQWPPYSYDGHQFCRTRSIRESILHWNRARPRKFIYLLEPKLFYRFKRWRNQPINYIKQVESWISEANIEQLAATDQFYWCEQTS